MFMPFVPISKDRTTINENLDIMEMNGSAMVDTEQEKSPKNKAQFIIIMLRNEEMKSIGT